MLQKSVLFFSFFIYVSGFKIYFEHEDIWEEENEILSDARYQQFQLIFPGTKWCGTGNIASDYDDLGSSAETDMCCREHDLCDDVIETNQIKYNLTNEAFYTSIIRNRCVEYELDENGEEIWQWFNVPQF